MSEFFNEYVIIELKIIFIGINNIDNKIAEDVSNLKDSLSFSWKLI